MQIQVVQDIVCPWCRIGKRNLDAAIDAYREKHDDAITVEWVPFLLDPVERGSKEPFQERLRLRKNMTQEQIEGMFARASEAGKAAGLDFHWNRIAVAVDTIPAHQLIAVTPPEQQSALLDGLHTAYFENGQDIGDTAVLELIANAVGVPTESLERARIAWASEDARREVVGVVQQVQAAGVNGVPFFIFDGALAANGAQPAETLLDAMNQAREMPVAAETT